MTLAMECALIAKECEDLRVDSMLGSMFGAMEADVPETKQKQFAIAGRISAVWNKVNNAIQTAVDWCIETFERIIHMGSGFNTASFPDHGYIANMQYLTTQLTSKGAEVIKRLANATNGITSAMSAVLNSSGDDDDVNELDPVFDAVQDASDFLNEMAEARGNGTAKSVAATPVQVRAASKNVTTALKQFISQVQVISKKCSAAVSKSKMLQGAASAGMNGAVVTNCMKAFNAMAVAFSKSAAIARKYTLLAFNTLSTMYKQYGAHKAGHAQHMKDKKQAEKLSAKTERANGTTVTTEEKAAEGYLLWN